MLAPALLLVAASVSYDVRATEGARILEITAELPKGVRDVVFDDGLGAGTPAPLPVDLGSWWSRLGVGPVWGAFREDAPLAAVRRAITRTEPSRAPL